MSITVLNAVPICCWRPKPGQVTNPTTRMPPSVVKALCRRDGAVAACAQRGPYQMNEFAAADVVEAVVVMLFDVQRRSGAPRIGIASTIAPSAPLSDKKITTVSSSSPVSVEVVDHPADVVVHPVDHGGVDLHAAGRQRLLLSSHARPTPARRRRRPGARRRRARHRPSRLQRGQSLLAQGVRAGVVAAAILRNGLLGRLQRPVRRLERQIGEERPVVTRCALGSSAAACRRRSRRNRSRRRP